VNVFLFLLFFLRNQIGPGEGGGVGGGWARGGYDNRISKQNMERCDLKPCNR